MQLVKMTSQGEDLIKTGCNINVKDKFGYSALHVASSNQLLELVKLLIRCNIDLDMQDKKGQTFLHYAATYNQIEEAIMTLKKGADITKEDIYGNQPLWTATFNDKGMNKRREIIKLFLDYGADLNHKNHAQRSPKDIVVIAGYNNLSHLFNC